MTRSAGSQPAQEPQTVAGVPRLFVGQVPTFAHEQDLLPLFAKHGEVESIMVVRGPDQKSRGCAMVQFKRWAAAEAAAEALHGTTPLDGSKGRHIVINFARPRKGSATTPAEPAIIPRRLFISQIPAECGADELRALLGRFGDIESLSLTEAKPGVPGWAHVDFTRWTACEAAIDELHQRHTLPGSPAPLTVRFLDMRRPDGGVASPAQQPASSDSSESHFANPMTGHLGARRGVAPHPQGAHNYYVPPHYAAMMQMQGAHHYMLPGYATQHMAAAAVMGYPPPMDPSAGSPHAQGHGQSSDGGSRGGRGSGGRRTPSSGGPSSRRGLGSAGSSDSLGNISDASATDPAQHGPPGGAPPPQMHPAMMSGADPAAFAAAAAMGHPQQYLHPAYYPMYAMPPMAPPHGRKVGRGVADPVVYQHKLFVGQVPFEAAEQDLWHLFAPFGDILELAVLRSGGVSKGCAFLTYATRAQAVHAMTALHGHQVGTNKRLVVKFADHKPNGGGALVAAAAGKKQQEEDGEPQEELSDVPAAEGEP